MPQFPAGNVSQCCYEQRIPAFAEHELERLYGSMYSSLAHFQVYGGLEAASTYVATREGKVAVLLLYRITGGTLRVINEWMRLSADDIRLFSNFVFDRYPHVNLIRFHAIEPEAARLQFPYQRIECSENIVVTLPSTIEEYVGNIGAASRKNIKRHKNRLQRDFPSFSFHVFEKENIREEHIREIIAFNHARMALKGRNSSLDERETASLLELARLRGIVMLLTIDGRICAGSIAFRVGENIISRVNAHDPTFDSYRLGIVCCYMSVCEAIRQGAREFHFMWGKYEYKAALLGVPRNLESLMVYRSYAYRLFDTPAVMQLVAGNVIREMRIALREKIDRDSGPLSRLFGKSLTMVKSFKRFRMA